MFFLELILAYFNGSVDLRSARYNIVPVFILNGILGTIVYWGLASKISTWNCDWTRFSAQLLQEIGYCSMIYLCVHPFPIFIMKLFFKNAFDDNVLLKTIVHTFMFLITMVVCRGGVYCISQNENRLVIWNKISFY